MNIQHFREARQSLKTKRWLSVLVVATMSIGIALLMTMQTTVYHQQRVPVPAISQERYVILTDSRTPDDDPINFSWQYPSLSWNDAQHLLNMKTPATRQSINYNARAVLVADDPTVRPVWAEGVATDNQFFSLFEAPFLFGGAWSKEASMSGEALIILTRDMNDKLFAGENSVGRTLLAEGIRTTVVGVLDVWPIKTTFYDRSFSDREMHQMYVPLGFATQNNLMRAGTMYCEQTQRESIGDVRRDNIDALMASDCGWINLWAEMASSEQAQEYQALLRQFVQEQQKLGRYTRTNPDVLVANINEIMELRGTDDWASTLLVMAYLFFGVCLVNTVGILLAKFLNHGKRVSLYRALGASKSYILKLHLIEVLFLGAIGALFGLILAYFGLELMFRIEMYQMDYHGDPKIVKQYFTLDWQLIGMAIGVALISIIVAGLYPIWKICNIPPASQLKS